jgi:NhaP-type Na+/H+ or K+/H+ antiporter
MTAFGFITYFTAQFIKILGLEMSGIISLLVYAIIQAHYTWYNLSPQGKATTAVTYEFLGKTAEAAVYTYVGLSLYTSLGGWWSIEWITAQLIIIIFGRIIAIIGTFYLFRLCFKKKTIEFKELMFITWGGMIRGAIAFALVLKIPYDGAQNCKAGEECYTAEQYSLAQSTTLIIVMMTTLIFGTFMKLA